MSEVGEHGTNATGAPPPGAAGRAPMLFGMALGIAFLAGGVLGFVLGRQRPATPEPPTAAEAARSGGEAEAREQPASAARPPSRERQLAARLLGRWSVPMAEPLAEPDGPATRFEPVLRLNPPFDAVDAALFDSLDTRIRLAHAKPVGRDEVCIDDAGHRSACGLKGRASLQNHMFGKAVTCTRLFLSADERRGVVDARCSIAGEDLAAHQIRAGYAFPTEHAEPEHWAALEAARRERAGVWSGPYSIPAQDQAEIDAREIPFGSLRLPAGAPVQAAQPPVPAQP